MPVYENQPRRMFTERNHVRNFSDGNYALDATRFDAALRVRIEADGYRSAISDAVQPGMPDTTMDLRLEAAPPLAGRVLAPHGKPVKDARVYLATRSQVVFNPEQDQGMHNQRVLTDGGGGYAFPAQCERYAIVVIHNAGYAEVNGEAGQQSGDLTLRPWSRIQGRLVQAGKPVPNAWISFHPLRLLGGDRPHVQDDQSVQTDHDGRFDFQRVPPIKGNVQAHLSVFRESPLTSSQWEPLDLQPGQAAEVELGGNGTILRGRVALSGDAASRIDLSKSLNWLLRRAPGIEPPAELAAADFRVKDGWNNVWTTSQEGYAFLQTLHTHFVTLGKDGRFAIHGVTPGDYDLALRLYEPPGAGCLVNQVGSRIIRITVSDQAARATSMDLGEIPIAVAIGPRAGDPAPELTLARLTDSGPPITLSGLRGRYVLLDFWATWCAPCIAELPALAKLHETYRSNDRLTLLGVNLDDDPEAVKPMIERAKASWPQGSLGGRDTSRDDILTRYAISSVPCYILVGPDGKLMHRGENLEDAVKVLERALR